MVRPQSAFSHPETGRMPSDAKSRIPDISAQAYLARLAERGIDYVFANAGTDFAPLDRIARHECQRKAQISQGHHRAP